MTQGVQAFGTGSLKGGPFNYVPVVMPVLFKELEQGEQG